MAIKTPEACPCGSGRAYQDCCGRFLEGKEEPKSPAELMRSRYTAYALGIEEWLRWTWAGETCPKETICEPEVKWIGLSVKGEKRLDADHATVEFVARGRNGSQGAFRMHAVSRFEKRQGRWVYVDDLDEDRA